MSELETSNQGFSRAWLSLREPADHQARSERLTQHLLSWANQHDVLHCVELGAGTGSNLRYLCPRLGHKQHWTLIDNDSNLLEQLPGIVQRWADEQQISCRLQNKELVLSNESFSARVSWVQQDLSEQLGNWSLADIQLVCASALLDLTSALWLEKLASLCINAQCAALFVLNYNGYIHWQDSIEQDPLINTLLNAHQLSDKGFGPALGPQAGKFIAKCFERHNRHVVTEPSNWQINPSMTAMQANLIEGWAAACIEQDVDLSTQINHWKSHRLQACHDRQSTLIVGHTDLLSLPVQRND